MLVVPLVLIANLEGSLIKSSVPHHKLVQAVVTHLANLSAVFELR